MDNPAGGIDRLARALLYPFDHISLVGVAEQRLVTTEVNAKVERNDCANQKADEKLPHFPSCGTVAGQ